MREILILLAGITFLNMGFILAEVSLLNLNKYYSVLDEVSTSLEDEQETGSESPGNDSIEEEIDLMNHFSYDHSLNLYFISLERKASFILEIVNFAYREIFSPPPEHLLLGA